MGRFGNVLLVAGEPDLTLTRDAGEVVRLYLTNTANTRVFNVALPRRADEARRRRQRPRRARAVRRGGRPGAVRARRRRRAASSSPASWRWSIAPPSAPTSSRAITVSDERGRAVADRGSSTTLRSDPELAAERERIAPYRGRRAGQDAGVRRRDGLRGAGGTGRLQLPDAPRGRQAEDRASCPQCGMKLLPTAAAVVYTCPMHPDVVEREPRRSARSAG